LLTSTALAGALHSEWLRRAGWRSEYSASAAGGSSAGGKGGPIRIGFIPLTDCASVVMAHELGLYKKHGVDVEVIKQRTGPARATTC
jgi:ABC-type nitrate/sulfonate/bicarbonate transport system substrate-binding protein